MQRKTRGKAWGGLVTEGAQASGPRLTQDRGAQEGVDYQQAMLTPHAQLVSSAPAAVGRVLRPGMLLHTLVGAATNTGKGNCIQDGQHMLAWSL